MADRDEAIRERAYAIWEEEGCPEGMEQQHWLQAEAEIGEDSFGAPASVDTISAIPLDTRTGPATDLDTPLPTPNPNTASKAP